jgi:hypothetical protein
MTFLKSLFRGSEKVAWEAMPRTGKSQFEMASEQVGSLSGMQVNRFEMWYSPERLAETACHWNVPTYFAFPEQVYCILKIRSLSDEVTPLLVQSISGDKVKLECVSKPMPTYPIVSLVLQVPTPARTFNLEALPDLSAATVRDALDALLKQGAGVLYLLLDDPPQVEAKGKFAVDRHALRLCLDAASSHFHSIDVSGRNYQAAARLYDQSTTL